MVKLALFAALVALPAVAAEQMKCKMGGAVRCPCPASLSVQCEGYTGSQYIGNDQKVSTIKAVISANGRTKEVTLDKPTKGIRDYYGGDTLKEELRKAGHSIGEFEDVSVTEFTADPDIKLYTEPGPDFGKLDNVPVARKAGAGGGEESKFVCSYVTSPSTAAAEACGKQKICFAVVSCKGYGEVAVGCAATGDTCPTASKCAEDEVVSVTKPKNARDFSKEVEDNKDAKEHSAGGEQ
jgi:hypothetical protein